MQFCAVQIVPSQTCLAPSPEKRQKVERVIKPKVDHVRFYTLCERCLKKTKTTAGKEVLSDFPDALVVG